MAFCACKISVDLGQGKVGKAEGGNRGSTWGIKKAVKLAYNDQVNSLQKA